MAIDPVEERYRDLLVAIGQITLFWAYMEISLDRCVYTLFVRYGGRALDPQIPRALKRKLEFATRCFQRIDTLGPVAERGKALMKKISDASDDRHWCIHGGLTQFAADGTVHLARPVYEKERLTVGQRQVPVAVLLERSRDFRALATEVHTFGNLLSAPFEDAGE